jgi:hypothetical protein
MRVVIDATPLLVRSAGVKNYLYHWIMHLRRVAGGASVRHISGDGPGAPADPRGFGRGSAVHVRRTGCARRSPITREPRCWIG